MRSFEMSGEGGRVGERGRIGEEVDVAEMYEGKERKAGLVAEKSKDRGFG